MWNRRGMDGHLFLKIAFGLGLMAGVASVVFAADHESSDQPLYNIVAVGRGRGKILLANLASPADKMEWRFREIPVSPSDQTVRDVRLSVSGTKALVVFSD